MEKSVVSRRSHEIAIPLATEPGGPDIRKSRCPHTSSPRKVIARSSSSPRHHPKWVPVCWHPARAGQEDPHRCGGIVSDHAHRTNQGRAVTSLEETEQTGTPPTAPGESSNQTPSPDLPESVSAHRRMAVSIAVELAAIGVLSAGSRLIRPWAGLIMLGVGLTVLGMASSSKFDRRRPPQ